jgi:hypothetical protein
MKSYAIRALLKEIAESIKLSQFFVEDEAEGMFKEEEIVKRLLE